MLMELKGSRISDSGYSIKIRFWINPAEVSDIIENSGGAPACILFMKNGNKYDVDMSGNKLACAIIDFNRGSNV